MVPLVKQVMKQTRACIFRGNTRHQRAYRRPLDLVELVEPVLIAPRVLEVVAIGRIRQRREQSARFRWPPCSFGLGHGP
jgi:hypothetical protein